MQSATAPCASRPGMGFRIVQYGRSAERWTPFVSARPICAGAQAVHWEKGERRTTKAIMKMREAKAWGVITSYVRCET
jgi:hypothetical protein